VKSGNNVNQYIELVVKGVTVKKVIPENTAPSSGMLMKANAGNGGRIKTTTRRAAGKPPTQQEGNKKQDPHITPATQKRKCYPQELK
jgi:hypothetical protein